MMLVSHRGPRRFSIADDGTVQSSRGSGGIASALLPLLAEDGPPDAWIAAAIDEGDRAAVAAGAVTAPGLDLQLLALDPEQHRLHYDLVSNATLWFLHHGLFDLPRRPRFDRHFREAWAAYVAVNEVFAAAVVERADDGEVILVQDYQLALVPGFVKARRPDLRVVHFTHTPFCGPNSIRMLPDDVARELCSAMAAVPCGFHTERWARAYEASAREVLGYDSAIEPPFAAALGPDATALAEASESAEAAEAGDALEELVGDRALVLRSDRIDPSKNIVRGFLAYDVLLSQHPECRGRVIFVAMLNSSRESLAEYLAYQQEVELAAARVNDRWARPDWQPVVVDTRDDYEQSIAGFARYDVLFVNPVKDGLNLVAKEGPLVNRRDGVVCLSPEAGAFEELGEAALPVHPYDLDQAASSMHTALVMGADERAARARRLRELAATRTPRLWLDDLIAHAGPR